MNNEAANSNRLSRRELIRLAGLAGMAVAANRLANTFPGTLSSVASAQDETPEGFLAWAYAQRALAMTTNNPKLLQAIYDPANSQLLAFENDRVGFTHDLGSRWQGKLLSYDSSVSLVELSVSGSLAKMRIYETLRLLWIPKPRSVSPAGKLLRQQYPEKFVSTTPRGLQGEIASGFGIRHEIVLEKQTSGWRLVQDSYEEPDLFGRSPDLKPGAWSAEWFGLPSHRDIIVGSPLAASQAPDIISCTTYNYDYNAARTYALNHCTSYNSDYCNYNNCGGDCANFVSQCLRWGNQIDGGNWHTVNGACGNCSGQSSAHAGTDTWANDTYLRNWIINSGRAVSKSGIDDLGIGDLVSYDWTGDGGTDHIAIQNDPANNCVCSHNPDRCNVDWQLGGASAYRYTWVNVSYCA